MILLTMTIPDDPAKLPSWLEQRLMAPDFGQFIAELSAFFPSTAAPPRDLVEPWLPVALNEGLTPVPPEVLSQLLRHPDLLAELQEKILIDGGPYWDDLPVTQAGHSERLERGKLALERTLAADIPPNEEVSPKALARVGTSRSLTRAGGRVYKVWAIVSTGVAACLAGVAVWLATSGSSEPSLPKAQIAWGWARPGGLAVDQSRPGDYLKKLATNAEEWSLYRPGDSNGVGTRIAEFRLGCTRLMHSNYGPLNPEDKAWLLEHCRGWARALDRYQQALDDGADPLVVRSGVDETVREIAAVLRDKAKSIKS